MVPDGGNYSETSRQGCASPIMVFQHEAKAIL